MSGFEENEISKNANGGTELAKRKLASILDPDILDDFQIVSSRVRDIDESKIRIFWAHDLPEDPESNKFREETFKNQFHKYVFISNWQYQRYQLIHGIPYDDKSIVIESGIEPAPSNVFEMKYNQEKIRLVYTSTPQRGLEILVPVFEKLAETNPDIHLDVFSSFKIYGWDDADNQFEPLYDRIRNHPQMTYHGFVPNEQLKEHLNTSHIFAYPSIWLETSCRAMLEAMSAGLVCVHPNFGALAETSGGLNMMYHGDDDRGNHALTFVKYLDGAIKMVRDKNYSNFVMFNKSFVDNRYNIIRIQNQWNNLLFEMKNKYPSVENRQPKKQEFVYRTT